MKKAPVEALCRRDIYCKQAYHRSGPLSSPNFKISQVLGALQGVAGQPGLGTAGGVKASAIEVGEFAQFVPQGGGAEIEPSQTSLYFSTL